MWQMLRKRLGSKDGFTLIELVVVVAILGLLAVIVTPKVMGAIDNAKTNGHKSSAKQIQVAMERYLAEKGAYPNPSSCAGYNASTSPTCTLAELKTTLGLGSYVNLDAANLSDTTPIPSFVVTTGTTPTFTLELNFKDGGTAVKKYTITPDSIAP